ncbi:hypothetical protein HDU85_006013 [Gaertneriomyces sp. JEL0708]|nr:hypothetical protein HDU85_006013 [Gaertneriomyces sp. JEL0708]
MSIPTRAVDRAELRRTIDLSRGSPDPDPASSADYGLFELDQPPPAPVRKPREPLPKLDANRLLGPKGLPRLMTLSKKLSLHPSRSQNHKNLQKLLTFYQIWGHSLYPKLNFQTFIEQTEKKCHERRLKVFLDSCRIADRRMRAGIIVDDDQRPEEDSAEPLAGIDEDGTDPSISSTSRAVSSNAPAAGLGRQEEERPSRAPSAEPVFNKDEDDIARLIWAEDMEY